jgi:puromycin-sensitive aminopeptidase
MAASVLGPENFRKGLQIYMARHKYSNTVTTDLWQAWSEASGIDMLSLMASWTEQMGYPYLKVVSEAYDADKKVCRFELEQNWFLADGSSTAEENSKKVWKIPLLFGTHDAVSDVAVVMEGKSQTFEVPVSGPLDFVKINAGQQSMVRVAYTAGMLEKLMLAIRSNILGPVDRAALLLDAYALAKAGYAQPETVVKVLTAFANEDNSTVWMAIEGVLGGLNLLMEHVGGSAYVHFRKIAGAMVKRGLERVDWDSKPSDGHVEKLLRSTVIGLLDVFCYDDADILAEARRRYDAHWTDPSALSSDYKVKMLFSSTNLFHLKVVFLYRRLLSTS